MGESNAVTTVWFKTTLPTLLSNYYLHDIFNADKFGLFDQVQHGKTLYLKREKRSGGKLSKVRLSEIAAANAYCEKLPMFLIDKSKEPRCFYRAGTEHKQRAG